MTTKDFIDKLGGNRAIAAELGIGPNAVVNWKQATRNIPWKHKPRLAKIAAERGIELPAGYWGAA